MDISQGKIFICMPILGSGITRLLVILRNDVIYVTDTHFCFDFLKLFNFGCFYERTCGSYISSHSLIVLTLVGCFGAFFDLK